MGFSTCRHSLIDSGASALGDDTPQTDGEHQGQQREAAETKAITGGTEVRPGGAPPADASQVGGVFA